ncbi:hypothetical protein [Cellulophaga sp. Hel_I_12]|uniref:hypothetical protein n=1 Tax=Cellulophaga sp. Hel_I_12 TaxID=1249972 RepID=UPI00064618BB|nr:hypothetical protein [Cellulophaga sp. Hel_I_12]
MKTIKNILLLLAFTFLSFAQAQEPTVIITLTVDTSALGDDRDAPGGCTFTVTPADKLVFNDPNDPKAFTIAVDESDLIEWQGITTTGDDVKIKKISFIGGTEIFGSSNINGRNSNGKEKVKAKPNKKTPPGKDYEYSINFKPDGFKFYQIDPKIRVGIR